MPYHRVYIVEKMLQNVIWIIYVSQINNIPVLNIERRTNVQTIISHFQMNYRNGGGGGGSGGGGGGVKQFTINHLWITRCVTARFVTRFNLWLWHDLWPHNASICDPARFVTKSASICDQRYTMILESKLCRGKLVFVFTLIMYTKW